MKKRQEFVKTIHKNLSKRSKAKLLYVNLSSCYVKNKPQANDTLNIMNEIHDIYAIRPFQGYRRITLDLKDMGYIINHKKVYSLMKKMGLQALYPKKNLSKRNHEHKIYPYLLKKYPPQKPHDVWCVDITYIKISSGFIYLTALIDVVSRHVMGWHISNSLDTQSCLNALENAIASGHKPDIINSDQGAQFTSQEWVYQLSLLGCKISMDSKGRALDNIPIERFWRTIKYEEVYLKTYESIQEAKLSLKNYIEWYNNKRAHSGINNYRPYEVMKGFVNATQWPFMQITKTTEAEPCGYVEKFITFPQDPQGQPLQSTKIKQEKIKQQKKIKLQMNHSSKIAA